MAAFSDAMKQKISKSPRGICPSTYLGGFFRRLWNAWTQTLISGLDSAWPLRLLRMVPCGSMKGYKEAIWRISTKRSCEGLTWNWNNRPRSFSITLDLTKANPLSYLEFSAASASIKHMRTSTSDSRTSFPPCFVDPLSFKLMKLAPRNLLKKNAFFFMLLHQVGCWRPNLLNYLVKERLLIYPP